MANTNFGTVSDTTSDATSSFGDAASRIQDNFGDAASRVQEKAVELGRQATDSFGATADYVRQHSMRDMLSDLETYVKAHPTQALLGAIAVGFCAGRALRRD